MTDWKEFWLAVNTLSFCPTRRSPTEQNPLRRVYIDPHDPSVPLEVLMRKLVELLQTHNSSYDVEIDLYDDSLKVMDGVQLVEAHAIDRAGIISAICKLVGIKEADNG